MVAMALDADKYHSVKLTRFYMKVIGIWYTENRREQLIMNAALTYTIAAIIFAIAVEAVDLFNCWGDFYAVTYNACATMPLVTVLLKISCFMVRRDVVFNLIAFTEKNIWQGKYDSFDTQILRDCETKGVLLIYTFTFLVQGVVVNYILAPIIESWGKNETERILPFKLWIDLPLTLSPYYEITFTIQALSTIHSGICTFCFDNFMCILNIFVAGQFKILQHKLENICENYIENIRDENVEIVGQSEVADRCYDEIKECIKQHEILIWYIQQMESIFTLILLGQMLVSSLFMCLGGFQVFLAKGTIVRRLIFVSHLMASFTQLLLFTWTCNEIIVQSGEVAEAAYRMRWYCLPNHGGGRSLRQGLLLIMVRARQPCQLTAGKFCPMSLQAFTGILSTTLSYFTLLRQMSEDEI